MMSTFMNTLFHHAPRTFVIALCLCLAALSLHSSDAQARSQRGYIKKNCTYVQPHQKTNPDGNHTRTQNARKET
jgi:hypothetical protein